MAETVLFVCTSCQRADVARGPDEPRSGERLLALLAAAFPGLRVEPVSCMNNCLRACTVAFAAPGKWTYVFGEVEPEANLADVAALAALHAASADGQMPWSARPEGLRRRSISRIPPAPERFAAPLGGGSR
jgi:predicted metal-binding protein